MNIRLDLKFDGTHYHGWQVQPGKPTVQGVLKDTLEKLTGEKITVTGCGRTDSGVHARGYVANYHTNAHIPPERIPYALNSNLPDDIRCTGAYEADDEFCANSSAVSKCYRYTIDNSTFGDVFLRRYAWHYKYSLDIDKMRAAAGSFRGTHDFIGFASSGFSVKTTVRTIYDINIMSDDNIINIDVTGNGFLYNMVRIIAGTLVYVGGGRIDASDIPDIIKSRDRNRAGITAPAKGLCLMGVEY